jgi:hypothetical protein
VAAYLPDQLQNDGGQILHLVDVRASKPPIPGRILITQQHPRISRRIPGTPSISAQAWFLTSTALSANNSFNFSDNSHTACRASPSRFPDKPVRAII